MAQTPEYNNFVLFLDNPNEDTLNQYLRNLVRAKKTIGDIRFGYDNNQRIYLIIFQTYISLKVIHFEGLFGNGTIEGLRDNEVNQEIINLQNMDRYVHINKLCGNNKND